MTKKPPYIQSVWLADLIDFLQNNNIQIATKQYFTPHPQRRNDRCLMKEILNRKLYLAQLILLSTYRLYLQGSHLSDIVYSNGNEINPEFLIFEQLNDITSKFKWPLQSRHSLATRKLWLKTLKEVCQINEKNYLFQ